ncbi:MAG TPA: hypothetical protein VFV67_31870 [Actinophytocola sp.]|uniref:hypothetical protein n=1 Tax=Actinophytocola sp. TaxID=1872138 RepID=UPI002DB7D2F9|nr:hypothetical protein [Actinophytocola sp.]HEU5475265.1 hypothetical protein [Actinophytocola sp.]
MAQQSSTTPIFDQLLREMTEGQRPPAQPTAASEPDQAGEDRPAPRRRHRAE